MARWLFTSRTDGRIVVGQWPNLALWSFLAASALGFVVRRGAGGTIVHAVAIASLVAWALDEIARGVNPWRRLLGTAALLWLCARGALAMLHRG